MYKKVYAFCFSKYKLHLKMHIQRSSIAFHNFLALKSCATHEKLCSESMLKHTKTKQREAVAC